MTRVYIVANYGVEHMTIISVHASEDAAVAAAESSVARENRRAGALDSRYSRRKDRPRRFIPKPPDEGQVRCWSDGHDGGDSIEVRPHEVVP